MGKQYMMCEYCHSVEGGHTLACQALHSGDQTSKPRQIPIPEDSPWLQRRRAEERAAKGNPQCLAAFDAEPRGEPAFHPTVRMPRELLPETAKLVRDFASALAEKLYNAQIKYGYKAEWRRDDWRATCCRQLREHVEKGDPRDVAAYAVFAWYHGWSLAEPKAGFDEVKERAAGIASARELPPSKTFGSSLDAYVAGWIAAKRSV